MNVVVVSTPAISGNHNHYMKVTALAESEGPSRALFSSTADDLTRNEANSHLSDGKGRPKDGACYEIVISLKDRATFDRLSKDPHQATIAFRQAVREGLDALFTDLGVKDVRWTAAIHLNTDQPHAHVAVARDCVSIETGAQTIVNGIPRKWKLTNGDDTSSAGAHFERAIQRFLTPLPPQQTITLPPPSAISRQLPPAALNDTAGRAEQDRVQAFLTDEKELSPAIIQDEFDAGTIYAATGGACVFVHRDPEGNVTGATTRGRSMGQPGYYYVGDLRTATSYVIVDSPIEALSLYDLTRERDLSRVAFISLPESSPSEELISLIATRQDPVQLVWSRGLNERDEQDVDGLDETRTRFMALADATAPSVELITYAPPKDYGRTWNSQLIQQHLRDELASIDNAAASVERPAPRASEHQPVTAPQEVHQQSTNEDSPVPAEPPAAFRIADGLTSLPFVPTLPPEADILDGTRSFKKREADRTAARAGDQEPQPIADAGGTSIHPAVETNAVRGIPLANVLTAHGLRSQRLNGETVYADYDKRFVIKVTNDLFSDRKDNLNGGKGAIDLVMHLQGVDFKTAKTWLIDNYQARTTGTLADRPTLKDPDDQPKPLRISPPSDQQLQTVRTYLTETRGLSHEIVDHCISNGTLYANSLGSCLFVHRDPNGHVTGAEWRSTDTHLRGTAKGTDKANGWFYLGDPRSATRFVVVEAPIDALSYLDLHKESATPDTCFVSVNGGSVPHTFLEHVAARATTAGHVDVVWALDNNPAGSKSRAAAERSFERMTSALAELDSGHLVHVQIHEPAEKDWNDQLLALRRTEVPKTKTPGATPGTTDETPSKDNAGTHQTFPDERHQPERLISGREIVARYQLQDAEQKHRAAVDQTDLRRYDVAFDGQMRRMSVKDIENLAHATARRQTNLTFDAELATQQQLPRADRTSARVLRMELQERNTAAELARHSHAIETLRDTHQQVIDRLQGNLDRATASYQTAASDAIVVALQHNNKMPSPFIAFGDLTDLHTAAAKRGDAPAILEIDVLRQRQIQEYGYAPHRDDDAAARLAAQLRLAELATRTHAQSVETFEHTYHQRRFAVDRENRNDYMPETRTKEDRELPHDNHWSLKDVAKTRSTLETSRAWLLQNAAFHEGHTSLGKFLAQLGDQHFNPVTVLKLQAQIFTNPKRYFAYHLNPIQQLRSNPLMQGLRFASGQTATKEIAAQCLSLADLETQKLQQLHNIERSLKDQIDATRSQLQSELHQRADLREALHSGAENEASHRAAAGLDMPKPAFEADEIRRIEQCAMNLRDGELLNTYETEAMGAKERGLLKDEQLSARAAARETLTEARLIKAELQVEILDKVIDTSPAAVAGTDATGTLRVRDVTPVRVSLEGEDHVLSIRDALTETLDVQNAVATAVDAHQSRLAAALIQAGEFHQATTTLADTYRTDFAARGLAPSQPQFTVTEQLEIERFAAGVEDETLHQRFTEIAQSALHEGRVIGLDPGPSEEQLFIERKERAVLEHRMLSDAALAALRRSLGSPDPIPAPANAPINPAPTDLTPSTPAATAIPPASSIAGPQLDPTDSAPADAAAEAEAAEAASTDIFDLLI